MIWMIVAVMTYVYPDGSKDYQIWPEPTFSSQIECKRWGAQNLQLLHQSLERAFPTKQVEMISCVDLTVVNRLLEKDQLKNN
jgi:hypothetical protein